MNIIFEETKYCKYCNSKLKEIIYEIIELDKTTELNRYFCNKCLRVFYFREPSKKVSKKKLKKVAKKTDAS